MDNLTANNSVSNGRTVQGVPQLPWDDDDELDLKQLMTVLRRRAWIIGGIAAGVMGSVLFTTLRQEPVYEGTFQVLVEPVNADNQLRDFGDLLGDNLQATSSGLEYATQVQVLRSPRLIEQVMTDLRAVAPEID